MTLQIAAIVCVCVWGGGVLAFAAALFCAETIGLSPAGAGRLQMQLHASTASLDTVDDPMECMHACMDRWRAHSCVWRPDYLHYLHSYL